MATPAHRLIQDQNLNIHSTGTFLGGKIDPTRSTKKGALGGRRALVDISNSKNVGAMGKDFGAVGKDAGAGKLNSFRNLEKGKASGRKALSDLTNTVKQQPSLQNASGRNQGKKTSAIAERKVPFAFKEEGFLHNHEECLKAQRKTMDYDFVLETIGLTNGSSLVIHRSGQLKPESSVKQFEEMEDMAMVLSEDDDDVNMKLKWQPELPNSPVWEPLNENYWKDDDFLDFKLIESPQLNKF